MKQIILGLVLSSINLIPSSPITYVQSVEIVQAQVSAYTSSPDETDDTPHITASGAVTRRGIVACPSWLTFGTRVEIEGSIYECQDRMAGRYQTGNYFDVWVESKHEAYEWGRRNLAVTLLPS